jgi:hypothetical protein
MMVKRVEHPDTEVISCKAEPARPDAPLEKARNRVLVIITNVVRPPKEEL